MTKLHARNIRRRRNLRSAGCMPGYQFNCTRNQAESNELRVLNGVRIRQFARIYVITADGVML